MDIQKKLAKAYFWNIFGKWGARLLGIGSTLILVRLIDPEAFGLVALATICIGFFATLTGIGVERYLISQTELDTQALNSGWTLNILLKFVVTIALVASSGFLANYFNEPALDIVIVVVAINGFFASLNNIGLVKLTKNLDFKSITYLQLVVKVFSTIVTLTVAYFNPDHWALIAGGIVSVWLYMIGSYVISPYRPKLSFCFDKNQFSFSVYILIRNILSFCRNKADTFIVSKLFNTSAVGKYNIGLEFAVLPFSEVITPASAAIFPGLANYKNDREQLFDKTYKYFALIYLFVIPCIVGIWVVAPQFCPVILGDKWADTAPIMAALAVMMLPYPLTAITNNLFEYLGKTKLSLFGDAIGLGLLVLSAAILVFDDINEFAQIRGYVGIVAFSLILFFCRVTIGLSLKIMFTILIIPSIAACFMFYVFEFIYMNNSITLLGLLINMFIGALSYCLCFFILLFLIKPYSSVWAFWYERITYACAKLLNRNNTVMP
ncbi:MAG: lipopolysaccharide biosynthesis protein [Thalassotalea sp.]